MGKRPFEESSSSETQIDNFDSNGRVDESTCHHSALDLRAYTHNSTPLKRGKPQDLGWAGIDVNLGPALHADGAPSSVVIRRAALLSSLCTSPDGDLVRSLLCHPHQGSVGQSWLLRLLDGNGGDQHEVNNVIASKMQRLEEISGGVYTHTFHQNASSVVLGLYLKSYGSEHEESVLTRAVVDFFALKDATVTIAIHSERLYRIGENLLSAMCDAGEERPRDPMHRFVVVTGCDTGRRLIVTPDMVTVSMNNVAMSVSTQVTPQATAAAHAIATTSAWTRGAATTTATLPATNENAFPSFHQPLAFSTQPTPMAAATMSMSD